MFRWWLWLGVFLRWGGEKAWLAPQDYHTPASKELSRDLTSQLNLCIQFLVECRPLSVSMGTAIKNLKLKVRSPHSTRLQSALPPLNSCDMRPHLCPETAQMILLVWPHADKCILLPLFECVTGGHLALPLML